MGNDDDCKYTVKWTSNAVYENTDIFFTMTATTTVDGMPAPGAKPYAEAYLDATHEAPPTNSTRPSRGSFCMIFLLRSDWRVPPGIRLPGRASTDADQYRVPAQRPTARAKSQAAASP